MAEQLTIRDNHGVPEILVYGLIDNDMATAFANTMAALEGKHPVLNIRINSVGGVVADGIAMYNTIKQANCAVDGYVDGMAASMASALLQACRKRYMSKYGQMMTHLPKQGVYGSAQELKDAAAANEPVEDAMADLYAVRVGITIAEAKAKFLNGTDQWMAASQAKANGLVDGIYDGIATAPPAGADIYMAYDHMMKTLGDPQGNPTKRTHQTTIEMRQISPALLAQIMATLGVVDGAEEATMVAALQKLKAKAEKADGLEMKLKTLEAEAVKEKVDRFLEEAVKAQKITMQQRTVFAEDYATNPDGLKRVLEASGFTSVTAKIAQSERGGRNPQVATMMAEGWDRLHKADRLRDLKMMDEAAYLELYKQKYGYLPGEKPFKK